jgi:DNA polymerase-3 subunit delta
VAGTAHDRILWFVGDRFLIAPEVDKAVGDRQRLTVDGAHLDVSELIAEISTSDLFSGERAIVVDDFRPRSKELTAQRRARLKDALGALPCGLVLVFTTYPEPGAGGPANDLEKALSKLGRKIAKQAPPEWRERELASWVTSYAHSKGMRISAEAAAAVVEEVGSDLGILAQEIDKVILSMDESAAEIALGDLEIVSRGAVGFHKLLRAVGARDARAALQALEDLLRADEEPAAVLGALSASARMIARARMAAKRGATRDMVAQELGVPPGRAYYLLSDARRICDDDVEAWLDLLLECDVALKRRGDPKQLLSLLVLGLCAKITPDEFRASASAYSMLD